MSLVQARAWLWARLRTGNVVQCPCCARDMAVYKWQLYGTAVRLLALYYRAGATDHWVSRQTVVRMGHKGGGDESRLEHWGLIEQKRGERGMWRVTQRGESFLFGELAVPQAAFTCVKEVLFFDGPEITIEKFMPKWFNYDLLRVVPE